MPPKQAKDAPPDPMFWRTRVQYHEREIQGITRKLRYFADKEFDGLHRSPDAQPISPKSQT